MTNKEIKSSLNALRKSLKEAHSTVTKLEKSIQTVQSKCPHSETKSWQDNDGWSDFKATQCLICGKLKDSRWIKDWTW